MQDAPQRFFVTLGNHLGDEAALKQMLGVKGASGIRCCPRCLNVAGLRANEQESYAGTDASGYLVDISCSQLEAFDAARDADLWRASDILQAAAGGATRGELAAMETSLGLNLQPHGVLADDALRQWFAPVTTHTNDSMHCVFASGGTAQVELFVRVKACQREVGLSQATAYQLFASGWCFPRSVGGDRHPRIEIFAESRHVDDNVWATASETLQPYHIALYLAELTTQRSGTLVRELESLRALALLCDLIERAKKSGDVDGRELDAAASGHLAAFCAAYSKWSCKPKHHLVMHLGRQLRRDGLVLDCFVHERKHAAVKEVLENLDPSAAHDFERSCLARIRRYQGQLLASDHAWRNGLVGKREPLETIGPHAAAAQGMSRGGVHIHANDVVKVRGSLWLVRACVTSGVMFGLLAYPLRLVERKFATVARWSVDRSATEHVALEGGESIEHPKAWTVESVTAVLTLGLRV